MKEQIQTIAEHYGYDNQSRQLIEEMSELTVAINKYWRKILFCGKKKIENVEFPMPEESNVIEEIADVEIMLEQMKLFFACHDFLASK